VLGGDASTFAVFEMSVVDGRQCASLSSWQDIISIFPFEGFQEAQKNSQKFRLVLSAACNIFLSYSLESKCQFKQ